jgi:uncharacterized repeat protein (TIGR04052 family)
MRRNVFNGSGLLCAALAFLSASVSCSSGDSVGEDARGLGTVTLAIKTPDGQTINTVSYVVTNAAGEVVVEDVLNVSSAYATISVEISLPAGAGYEITMTTTTVEGSSCEGSAQFDVVASETVPVALTLNCGGGDGGEGNGHVVVDADVVSDGGSCPQISTATVGPLTVGVGDSIALHANASSPGVSFSWSATSGTIADPAAASTTLLCTAVGPAEVTLTVTAGATCSDSETFSVNCVENLCRDLGRNCHVVDQGTGVIAECHSLGHANDADACEARRDECVQACGAALCPLLGSTCHNVDPGSGPLHDCHVLGHAGDAAACFARGRECFDLCTAAQNRVPVSIQFAAAVGGEDFACGQTYANQGTAGTSVTPRDFRFYVQDVRLINAAGQDVPVTLDVRAPWQTATVAMLDFEDGQGACLGGDAGTNAVITGTVPAGTYVGVAFRNGVPEDLNHDDPTTLPAPLQSPGMHWSWLSGFRFMRAQLSQSGGAAQQAFEPGSTGCSGDPVAGTVVCSRPNRNEVRFGAFNATTNTIVADIGAIFAQLNLSQTNECHGTDAVCETMYTALGVNFSTGAALAAQQVYRVE